MKIIKAVVGILIVLMLVALMLYFGAGTMSEVPLR